MMSGLKLDVKVLIVDFEDSFVYNFLGFFKREKVAAKLIHWKDLRKILYHGLGPEWMILLGPGPGHPNDYKSIFPAIKELMNKKFLLGVCLGHQILGILLGGEVIRAKNIVHGAQETYPLDYLLYHETRHFAINLPLKAQRYNSLALNFTGPSFVDVKFYSHKGEVYLMSGASLLSFQFHIESIGTQDSEKYFAWIVEKGKKFRSALF